MSKNRVYR